VRVRVETYSGYKADERPLRFYAGERRYEVEEVQDQWVGPGAAWFRVKADDGCVYVLRHALDPEDAWTIESFRRAGDD